MRRTKAQQTTNSHETYRSLFSTDRERPAAAPLLSPSMTAVSAGVLGSSGLLGSAGVLGLAGSEMSSKASV